MALGGAFDYATAFSRNLGWVTALSGSQRIGFSTVLALLLIGALFLLPVREAVPVQE